MNRTDRLYAIGNALRAAGSRGRTATWLADRFEVSTRTIKRDMAALLQAGLAVTSQDGRGGGYQLSHYAALPPITFTAAEATAITIALAADPQIPFAADGAAVLQKVLAAMSATQRRQATDVGRRVWMARPVSAKRPGSAGVLDQALRSGVLALIDYEDAKGRLSRKRAIEPMAFVRTHSHWHVLAWCHKRDAGRWLRLDRIHRARLTAQPCAPRDLAEVFGEPPDYAQPVVLPV
ncbi:MAG: WYL domain-containing protein [Nannocystaceae bacterium]|nr:WYL domain-containing protein [Nannocystaceae bacterium]